MRPYLRVANVFEDRLDLSDVMEMNFSPDEFEVFVLRYGDVLLNEGQSPHLVGRPAIWRDEIEGACFTNSLIRFRAHPGVVPEFAMLVFRTQMHLQRYIEIAKITTNIAHLSLKRFVDVEFPLPPMREQQRIVAEIEKQFTRLDTAVANLERVRANLKRARASILKAAVEGRLVPTEAELARAEGRDYEPASVLLERILEERERKHAETNGKKKYQPPVEPNTDGLPELPEGWVWASAAQVCVSVESGSTPTAEHLFAGEGDVPFLKVYNLTFGRGVEFSVNPTYVSRSTHEGRLARSRTLPGDVLINIVGPPLGKVSVVPSDHPEWNINQAIVSFRPSPALSTEWLAVALESFTVQSWLRETTKTTTSQVNISVGNSRKVPLPLPPLVEQDRIASEVNRRLSVLDAVARAVKRNLTRCSRLRQSILKRAFEGKLVPQDPNDEPASELLACIQAEAKPTKTSPAEKKNRRARKRTPA